MKKLAWLLLIPALLLSTSVIGKQAKQECGIASWYSLPGQTTASGERMNPHALTAAHKHRKFGSVVTVVNEDNGQRVTVKINDRGPFVKGRIIDLSRAAGQIIGLTKTGTAHVCIIG